MIRRKESETSPQLGDGIIKRSMYFLSIGLVFEVVSSVLALTQSMSSGAFEIPECGQLATAMYVSDRIVQDCIKHNEYLEAFFSEGNWTFSNHTSCGSVEDLPSRPLCDCSWFDESSLYASGDDCAWTAASLISGEGAGLCVAMPLREQSVEAEARTNVTAGWYLDRNGFVDDLADATCFPVHPSGFKTASIVLVVVTFGAILMEAILGLKSWKDRIETSRWMVALSTVAQAAGIATALSFLDWGVAEDGDEVVAEVSWEQFKVLWWMTVCAWLLLGAGAMAEIWAWFSSCSGTTRRSLFLDAFGNMSIWLGAALAELVITAYVTWRQPQNADGEMWSIIGVEFASLVVAEVAGVILVSMARVILTRAKLLQLLSEIAALSSKVAVPASTPCSSPV